jgi:D-serine deaminase-like pyridoxal phosphate-dependent protein
MSAVTQGLRDAVAALRERRIGPGEKGFGPIAPVTAADLAGRRPGLFGGGFSFPLIVLRESALRQNIEAMAAYCAAAGADLAPHGKTTMAPQLFARQLAAGAWAMTAATPSHLRVYREFGVPRILLANQLTDPAGIAWLAGQMAADPGFDCYVYVDSLPGVRLLDEAFTAAAGAGRAGPAGRRLPVLVELGQPGGRAGCRTVADALTVARAAAATGSLRLAGAAGYEGSIGHDATPATLDAVAAFCRDLRILGERLREVAPGPERLVVTAGGSSYFDVVARELTAPPAGDPPPRVVLRSGAYVTHDHGRYAGVTPGGAGQPDRTGPGLAPAFELWANVLSRPEPGLAIVSAGRRDVAFDAGLPLPLRVRGRDGGEQEAEAAGMTVTKLDDQHAYLSVPPGSGLAPGDLICLGISHPCTTFDKWRVVPVVDDSHRVVDAIHTFF